MLFVKFLRWISGYFEFCIQGRFPERFLNLAARNGLMLWDSSGSKETLTAKAKFSDKNTALLLAKKSENELMIVREYGLPYLCRIYKQRAGLFFGLIIGSILCCWLSGFIWNIRINAPEGINSFEIREELRQLGFHEGIRFSQEDVNQTERSLKIQDKRISWLNINVFGTNAVIEISAATGSVKENDSQKNIGNLKSTADGTITRMNVRNGSAAVRVGEGITKGQLLVSGVMEYNDGTTVLSDSEGEIYAKTSRTVVLRMKKQSDSIRLTDNTLWKREFHFFGIRIPLTFCGNPEKEYFKNDYCQQAFFLNQELPLLLHEEQWLQYQHIPINTEKNAAQSALKKRLLLYEVFLLCSDDKKILAKNEAFSENKNEFLLTVNYIMEENVCEKTYVEIRES